MTVLSSSRLPSPTRRHTLGLLAAGAGTWTLAAPGRAQTAPKSVKIGILTDMSGPFADQAGPGSVNAANMAAEDFAAEAGDLKVEIIAGDHLNKPDVGSALARRWVDEDGVAAIGDLPNSAVGLAVANILKERNRVTLASSTASSDLAGPACAPTTVQWVTDTWAQANGVVSGMLRQNKDSWFFVTVDYALGKTLERDATKAVLAGGGRVIGDALHPLNTADLSSLLLQAQASGAKVIALANTGSDVINSIKQAAEFGILRSPQQTLAALFIQISDIHAIGLKNVQGLVLCEAFYWDLTDQTRAWSRRFAQRMGGRMPTQNHAGVYSSTLAYLRAVRDAGTLEGQRVVEQMRRKPIADPLFGETTIRPDGRAVHAMYIFRVKRPEDSRGAWDYYERIDTIAPDRAFRPLNQGGCKLVSAG
jgi:branched-chain amino acid transport system substrate-binding protein